MRSWSDWVDVFGDRERSLGVETVAGQTVTRERALKLSTVYACVSLRAEAWAQLPLEHVVTVFEPDEVADSVRRLPLPGWLADDAGPDGEGGTVFGLTESISMSLDLAGDFFAEVLATSSGEVLAVVPLDPDRVRPRRDLDVGRVVYDVSLRGGGRVVAERWRPPMPSGILHIKGLSMPGRLRGLSPLAAAREAIGFGLAAQEHGARFWTNSARTDFVIVLPESAGDVGEAVLESTAATWERLHSGTRSAHRPGVLQSGAKLEALQLPHDDMQFLETREYQAEDVTRWFRVPPHMVGLQRRQSSWGAGIEQQSLGFVRYTIGSAAARAERAMARLAPGEQRFRWNFAELERGDGRTRHAIYNRGRQGQYLSANDVRRLEGHPLIRDPGADLYVNPATGGAGDSGAAGDEGGEAGPPGTGEGPDTTA